MCFSTEASFSASVVILAIGIVSLKKSTTIPQKVLSFIPIIFGVQQCAEGVVWLTLSHPGLAPFGKIATYAFLIFSQVVWPIIVPLSIWLLEKHTINKKILGSLLVLGILVSCYLAYSLLVYKVQSSISCSHIRYDISYPSYLRNMGVFYLITTVLPPIISTTKRLRLLGAVIFISYVITNIFYEDYLISVWCFFSAIISIIVLSVIIKLNRPMHHVDEIGTIL